MAEYSQYKSESESEKGGQISAANKEEEKSESSDEVWCPHTLYLTTGLT